MQADIAIGGLTAVATGTLLIFSLADPAYSLYARVVAGLAFALSTASLARAGWNQAGGSWRVALSGLAAPPAHRLPLALMVVLPLLIWLLGLVAGVGLSVVAWYVAKARFRAPVPGFLRCLWAARAICSPPGGLRTVLRTLCFQPAPPGNSSV